MEDMFEKQKMWQEESPLYVTRNYKHGSEVCKAGCHQSMLGVRGGVIVQCVHVQSAQPTDTRCLQPAAHQTFKLHPCFRTVSSPTLLPYLSKGVPRGPCSRNRCRVAV
jgi:hypothetical protein